MKDSEFIELLNLYLDHEIAAEDTARLEAEVQSNPARRRVYQEYCRMQKACKMLAQDFASEADETPEKKVISFTGAREPVRSHSALRYASAGLLAAAACVAVVFVTQNRTHAPAAPEPSAIANVTPAPAQAPKAVVASQSVPQADRPSNSLSIRNRESNESLVLTSAQNDPHFAWMQDMRFTPLQAPDASSALRLESANTLRFENRTFNSGSKPLPADVTPIAIRFQK